MITNKTGIRVKEHRGSWYVVEEYSFYGRRYLLCEHEQFGEDAGWIAIDAETGLLELDSIFNGIEDLIEHLADKYGSLLRANITRADGTKKMGCAFCSREVNVSEEFISEHLVKDDKFHCGQCELPSDAEYYS